MTSLVNEPVSLKRDINTDEHAAALDERSLLHQTQGREMDLIDSLQGTADVLNKIIDLLGDKSYN